AKLRLVEIERVGANVSEDDARAAQGESRCTRHESKRRYDHFVARSEVEQQRGELERVRARRRQHDPLRTEDLFERSFAAAGERAVAGDVAVFDGLTHEVDLAAAQTRPVERDAPVGAR